MRRLLQQHEERFTKRPKYYQDTSKGDKENNYTAPVVNSSIYSDNENTYAAPVMNFPSHSSSQYVAADALPHHVPSFVAASHVVAHSYGTRATNSSFFTSTLASSYGCAPTVRNNYPDSVTPLRSYSISGITSPRDDTQL
ncbi:hypothetical protein L914_14034 [Phytophthora nicotianae]|uniref:Uncharacterized protein n=1 Tax=Phytophthora nicotianae TaxID=4792 RepID=W2IJ47_PHYNI|nr:hypothetical protein L916_14130 [Phytophthora nicotianae]ETM39869.1 hypothetical protein L914_14034 [Phytophthora nicotianae]